MDGAEGGGSSSDAEISNFLCDFIDKLEEYKTAKGRKDSNVPTFRFKKENETCLTRYVFGLWSFVSIRNVPAYRFSPIRHAVCV